MFNLIKSDLTGKTILITGGTTGLGFELMRQLLDQDCTVAICARNLKDLKEVKNKFPEVLTFVCDVGNKAEVGELIKQVIMHFGKLDILINNAGIIMVAPMEGFSLTDYEYAMSVMYWGIVNTTFAALPHMKKNKEGQIINITSIGGKVSIPYLLPYCTAKFAAVGFSEGITAELKKNNIFVTTIVPGLMRTGSYVNALFQKDNRMMFKIFSGMSSAPVLTMTAKKAARLTIRAMKGRKAIKVLGFPAKVLILLRYLFPETLNYILSYTAKLLPGDETQKSLVKGRDISEKFNNAEISFLEPFGHRAQNSYQDWRRRKDSPPPNFYH